MIRFSPIHLAICLLVSISGYSRAQSLSSVQIDSLLEVSQLSQGEQKVVLGERIIEHAASLSERQRAKAFSEIATGFFQQNKFRSALTRFEQASQAYRVLGDSIEYSRMLNLSGVCYTQLRQPGKAIETLKLALDIREKLGDTLTIASTLNNLAMCFRVTNQLDAAYATYKRSNVLARKVNYTTGISFTLNNMGLILMELDDFPGAIKYFEESIAVKASVKDTAGMASTYVNLGRLYTKTGDFPKALTNFEHAAQYHKLKRNNFGLSETYTSIASLYLKMGNAPWAYTYLKRAEQFINFDESSTQALAYLKTLSDYHSAVRNFSKAHEVLSDYVAKYETFFNESISNQVAEFSFMYESERVEQEKALLEVKLDLEKTKNQKSLILQYAIAMLAISLFVLLVASLLFILRLRKRRLELERANNELNNLNTHLETIVESRTQDLLSTLHKAQESDKLKSTFLANMSHEIRTPLNGILGFTRLLVDNSLTDSERKQYMDLIVRRGRNLLQIINDIINISLIDSGQVQIRPTSFNLNQLLYDLYTMFNSDEYDRKMANVELRLKLSLSDSRSFITADPNRIEQVVTNLLDNAFKFTPAGYVEYGYDLLPNNTIKFFVKDTGVGIPLESKDKIFSRIKHKDDDDPYLKKGAGLGLTICKGLLELLNGRIWFESQVDLGSTFYFTIPYEPGMSASSQYVSRSSVTMQSLSFSGKVILIVEDDLISYQYIEALLKSTDAKLIHAKNGEDAIEIAQLREDIDLIIMDMRLPFIDGYEATAHIKRNNPAMTIIAQTANAMSYDREKCINAGCDDYIPKPLDPDDFLRMVAHYLSKPVLA